jgi:hypothetical protein
MVLFWITSVFGLELGVHPALGLVLLAGVEVPPHAIISAASAVVATRVLRVLTVLDGMSGF